MGVLTFAFLGCYLSEEVIVSLVLINDEYCGEDYQPTALIVIVMLVILTVLTILLWLGLLCFKTMSLFLIEGFRRENSGWESEPVAIIVGYLVWFCHMVAFIIAIVVGPII